MKKHDFHIAEHSGPKRCQPNINKKTIVRLGQRKPGATCKLKNSSLLAWLLGWWRWSFFPKPKSTKSIQNKFLMACNQPNGIVFTAREHISARIDSNRENRQRKDIKKSATIARVCCALWVWVCVWCNKKSRVWREQRVSGPTVKKTPWNSSQLITLWYKFVFVIQFYCYKFYVSLFSIWRAPKLFPKQ